MQNHPEGNANQNISIHISDRTHWNLSLNVYNCGNQDAERELLMKPDYYIFYFVKEGSGYVTEKQAVHKVTEGKGFVAFPNEETRIKPEYQNRMNISWVAFSGYLVEQYLGRAGLTVYEPVFEDNEQREAEAMFDRLLAASVVYPNRYCKIMAQLYSIFGFLLDHMMKSGKAQDAAPQLYLIRALDFIDMNYMEDISVEDIAQSMGMNRKALYGIFKNLTGFSPKDYLIYYRMQKAAALLKDANLSVETVAASAGYRDQFHFSREFKKNTGLSPTDYRREVARDAAKEYRSPIDAIRQQYPGQGAPKLPPEF